MSKLSVAYAQLLHASPERVNSVDAGQDQPVVVRDVFQCAIQSNERLGLADLDKGYLQNVSAMFAQFSRECTCLMAGTAHQDWDPGKRARFRR